MAGDEEDPPGPPEVGVGVIRLSRPVQEVEEVEEELWTDDSGEDFSGWSCIATDPWPCPADGCSFVAMHITAAHLVICWPERDDPNLLTHAQIAKEVGRNPRVIEYERSMGPACSYYQWIAAGRPVHAIRGRPEPA